MAAALASIVAWELDWGSALHAPTPVKITAAPHPTPLGLLPAVSQPAGLAAYSEVTARPLLTPTRQPAPPAAPVQARPQMQRGQFLLVGTTIAGGRAFALLRELANSKISRVAQGEQIKGMQVDRIEPNQIVLRQFDETEVVTLKVAIPSKQMPPPAPQQGRSPPGNAMALPSGNPVAAQATQPGSDGAPLGVRVVTPNQAEDMRRRKPESRPQG